MSALDDVGPSDGEIAQRVQALVHRLGAEFVKDVTHPLLMVPQETFSLEEAIAHLGRRGVASIINDTIAPQLLRRF